MERIRRGTWRGKDIETGEWVYGYYAELPTPSVGAMIHAGTDEYIACEDTASCIIKTFQRQHPYFSNANPLCVIESKIYEINPDTLGECIGLRDKNDTQIFEGDIVKHTHGFCNGTGRVCYSTPKFALHDNKNGICDEFRWDEWKQFEVVGNKWDNPDLQ